jgi:tetratricopeptide (TPR) repeat protein
VYHFKNEFRALADVGHPNLVAFHELFADDQDFFLSMEVIDGIPISEYLRPGLETVVPHHLSERREVPVQLASHLRVPTQLVEPPLRRHESECGSELAIGGGPAEVAPSTVDLDWERIRRTFSQLVDAIIALHAAGICHRDIKPSNVLVTKSGRVVVLDFGLISRFDSPGVSSRHSIVGTPAYMAPEICLAQPYEEASDWYSVGVILFEVLAGRLPHVAESLANLLWKKVRGRHAEVARLNPAVPDDLARLCDELLNPEPAARPRGRDVLQRLRQPEQAVQVPASSSVPTNASSGRDPHFVGRVTELSALRHAFAARTDGRPVLVRVEGVSGMGKTALVDAFLERIVRANDALVLRGRCYQQEFLPYKAIDGLIDELSDYLARLAPSDVKDLLPTRVRDLARIFAVVAQVPSIGSFSGRDVQEDPVAVKRSAFAVLRELLVRIARERPLVLFIDDAHWGDSDSAAVLEELLRAPGGPPLLLIVAFRSEERDASPFLSALDARIASLGHHLDARAVAVAPLPPDVRERLAEALLGTDHSVGDARVRRIAEESEGHPLLLEELVRDAASPDQRGPSAEPSGPGHLLTRVIRRRIGELPPPLRALLDVVSLAGAPITIAAACRAAGMAGVDPAAIQHLLVRHFLRAQHDSGRRAIAPYHDRIRETVLEALRSVDCRNLHRALGHALQEQDRVPPRFLVTHFEAAGELAIAARYAVAAANEAEQAFAFKEAAELYRKVLQWAPGSRDEERRLQSCYADALFNQGLCREAAATYVEAAHEAPPAESGTLRTRAALSLMTCGAVREGGPLMRTVLREIGVVEPVSRTRVYYQLMKSLLRLRLRGLGYKRRADSEIPPESLRRIDTCYAAAHGYILSDFVRSIDLLAIGLLKALDTGEPSRLIEGCAFVGAFLGSFRWKSGERLLAMADSLAVELDNPFSRGISSLARACQYFVHDDWKAALQNAEEACQHLDRCAGVTTVQQFARIQRLLTLRTLERFADIEESSEQDVRFAREVGNPYFEASACLESVLPLLARNDIAGARLRLEDALRCAPPDDGYVVQSALTMAVKCDLYEGRWQRAHQQVERQWGTLRRSGMLIVPTAAEFYSGLRAGVALEVAARDPRQRTVARRVARKGLRALERTRSDFGRGSRTALLAAMACGDDRIEDAVRLCGEAAEHFSRAGLPVRAAALERRAGELECSAPRLDRADSDMAAHGIADPPSWTRSVAPGFPMRERD